MDDWLRFGAPMTSGAADIMHLGVTDSLGRHARAGTTYRKFHINALGFRGPEVTPAELHAGPLVVVSGASETFGLFESPRHEWPRQMADSLAVRCEEPPVVLNAAFAGMSLPTVHQDVRRRVLPLGPDLIVYYPQPSQYLFERVPRPSPPSSKPPEPLSPWNLRALPRLREDFKRMLPEAALDLNRQRETAQARAAGEALFPELPTDRLDSLEAHMRALVGTVRAGGAEIALVIPRHRLTDTTTVENKRWLRAWESINPKAPGRMIIEFFAAGEERVRAVAADSGVRLIDPAFADGAARDAQFADPNHFTDEGAAVMAGGASSVVGDLLGCGRS
jgi:hypothetical protein